MTYNDLNEILGETILNSQFDITIDWADFSIDKILESKGMPQVPIVNTLVGIYKITKSLHDIYLIESIFEFLKGLKNNTISKEKLGQMRNLYASNSARFNEDMKRIILILNKSVEKKQSECLGKIYRALINQNINYQQYLELSNLNLKMTLNDYEIMTCEFNDLQKVYPYCDRYSHLVGIGFVIKEFELDVGNINVEDDYGKRIIPPEIKHDYYCILSESGKIIKQIICDKFDETKLIS